MTFIRGLSLFLILFFCAAGFAKNRSLKNSLKAFTTLNKTSHAMCKFDDDDEEEKYTKDIVTCERPEVLSGGCIPQGDERELRKSNVIKMECKVCDYPVTVFGKVTDSLLKDNPDELVQNYSSVFRYPAYSHLKTNGDFSVIKSACTQFVETHKFYTVGRRWVDYQIPDVIENAKDVNDIFDFQSSHFETRVGDTPGDAEEAGGSVDLPALPVNGKTCNTAEDHDKEVESYVKQTTPNVDTGPTKPYRSLSYINASFKNLGFPNLLNIWSYETSNDEENKNYIENAIKMKLDPKDVKSKIHHLVFNQKPSDEDIEKILATAKLSVSKRLINPFCEEDKEEHLNVSVKSDDDKITTQRYKINCTKDERGRKTLTLSDL